MRIFAFIGVYLGSAMVAVAAIAWAVMHLEVIAPLVLGVIVVMAMVRSARAANRGRQTVAEASARTTPTAAPSHGRMAAH